MKYLQVLVPEEAAENFAHEMCTQELMMFTDLNENVQMFQRDYIKDITRINETERYMKGIMGVFMEFGVLSEDDLDLSPADLAADREKTLDLLKLSDEIQKFAKDLRGQVFSSREMGKQLEDLKDQVEVLQKLDEFMADAPEFRPRPMGDQQGVPLVPQDNDKYLAYLSGVCPLVKVATLRKQIYHITRGNRFFRSETIQDGQKAAFLVFFNNSSIARSMIKKFCEWMDVKIYIDSNEEMDPENMVAQVKKRIEENKYALRETNKDLTRSMTKSKSDVLKWNIQLKQEMAIRVLLNKFKRRGTSHNLRAEGWVPAAKKDEVEAALHRCQPQKQAGIVEEIHGKGITPTYFELNKFTEIFQVLINTYGVPRNGEFNPAVPAIVTFPFLFAMMYGDIFHGTFLFLGGCWLLYNEEANSQSKNEFIAGIHGGRYLIWLMGLFAIYNGLIYNDCTSISINGFNGSQWEDVTILVEEGTCYPKEDPRKDICEVENGKNTGVYGFGFDPVWAVSEVQLMYSNSVKMKLSVLVGITQMTFGLFLKLGNHIHEGDYLSIFGEFVPQLIFMVTFFNYMQFIIIYKWTQDWTGRTAPGLITLLVDMVLHPGEITEDDQLFEDADFQGMLQGIFLAGMFFSVPWMLLVKPLVLKRRMDAAEGFQQMDGHGEQVEAAPSHGGHGHGHEEETFGAIMIEQVIHTIEYVLGTVSNTASYLRLWALSLAHAQLAEVFYDKTILTGMKSGSGMMVFITCAMFFGITGAVLLMMDVLECFLHALRLHWVEFQNKFYYADGVEFIPYSYKLFLED